MKHKFMFGLQVFTTLILFMAIFVTYLERGDNQQSQPVKEIINSASEEKQQLAALYEVSFDASMSGSIANGK
jgi:hypothetical protein